MAPYQQAETRAASRHVNREGMQGRVGGGVRVKCSAFTNRFPLESSRSAAVASFGTLNLFCSPSFLVLVLIAGNIFIVRAGI